MSSSTCSPHDYVGNIRDGWICNKCKDIVPPAQAVTPHPPMHLPTVGETLADGIPKLIQNMTLSSPSVPKEQEHASCQRLVAEFPFVTELTDSILCATNTVWTRARPMTAGGSKFLLYGSENDVVHYVRMFFEDILKPLNIDLVFSAEVTIKQVRPDLCVLLKGMYLVGVVEIKKPGKNVLLEPTVLGELLDQMLLVEGFYGMGPVVGILTTAEEWIMSWFPSDSTVLASHEVEQQDDEATQFRTPLKSASYKGSEANSYSPPDGTPSQNLVTVHSIELAGDIPLGQIDNAELSQEMERVLCTTDVMNISSDPVRVLQLLCSAFQLMASSRAYYRGNLSRCLLQFHKGMHAVTFHPKSHDEVFPMVDFNKFPGKTVKTLVALEDLGRGSTGKAWLCATLTKPRSAVCVLKFDNKHSLSNNLKKERELWILLYPELADMVKLEQWSGADALVMPHLATVLKEERELYRDVNAPRFERKSRPLLSGGGLLATGASLLSFGGGGARARVVRSPSTTAYVPPPPPIAPCAAPMAMKLEASSAPLPPPPVPVPVPTPSAEVSKPISNTTVEKTTQPRETQRSNQQVSPIGKPEIDVTKLPSLLEEQFSSLDSYNALRPTIINLGPSWSRKRQAALLAKPSANAIPSSVEKVEQE
eukprot:gene11404-12745_t